MFNGPKLKELRQNRCWSQWDVAVRTSHTDAKGMTRMVRPENVAKYEKGTHQPSVRTASLLAAVFGLPVDALLTAPVLLHIMPEEAANG